MAETEEVCENDKKLLLMNELLALNLEIKKLGNKPEKVRKKEMMDLLHEYNDVKDAAQIVLSKLANIEGCTVKEIHMKYNLPLES